MHEYTRQKIVALLLVISLLLPLMPTAVSADTSETAEANNAETGSQLTAESVSENAEDAYIVGESETELPQSEIPPIVDIETARSREHISRVYSQEQDDLNKLVFQNADGTQTVYLYDFPVKYVDAAGDIRDISLEIADAGTGSGGYRTMANSVQTTFPASMHDGICLQGNGVEITLIPTAPAFSNPSLHTASRIDAGTIGYYYDSSTAIEYSLTYTGFKEDIVVSEYTGQTAYPFTLKTNGLTLTQINGSFCLTDESGDIRATVGDIIVFTADERNNTFGELEAETVTPNEEYRLTILLDEDYLSDPNTAYPIRIDPTIEVNYDSNGSGAIQDICLCSGTTLSGSSGSLYIGRRENYGICRALMKFPGLDLSGISSSSQITSATVEIRDLMCETTNMDVSCYIYTGDAWSESSASYSGIAYSTLLDTRTISYSIGVNQSTGHRYAFDITAAVRNWVTSSSAKDKGILFKAPSSVESGSAYEYRTFASYNRSSYRPSLSVTYNLSDGYLNYTSTDIDEGATKTLTLSGVSGTVTWTSSNTSVATVSSSGVVTGVKAGTATITASVSGYTPKTCTVYVTVPDGHYRIRNVKASYYMGVDDCSIAPLSKTVLQDYNSSTMGSLGQIWKVTYLSSGYYSIRPAYLEQLGLSCTNPYACVNAISTTETINAITPYAQWTISYNSTGYVIKNRIRGYYLQPSGGGTSLGTNIISNSYTSSDPSFRWQFRTISPMSPALLLYDMDESCQVNADTNKRVDLGSTASLSSLGLAVQVRDPSNGSQAVVWSSSDETVATVHMTTGAVTGISCGQATITVSRAIDGVLYSKQYTITVVLPMSGAELEFQPEIWNTAFVKSHTNCYAYVLNNQIDPVNDNFGCNYDGYSSNDVKQQPGQFYNDNCAPGQEIIISGYVSNTNLLITAVQKDFEMYNSIFGTNLIFTPIGRDEECPSGTYKVALVVSSSDYHWYRQDANGYWSHKRGLTEAKQLDEANPGQMILDPQTADRGAYSTFVGYFAMSPWNNLYSGSSTASINSSMTSIPTNNTALISESTVNSIQIGMSINDVIGILGYAGEDIGSGTIIHRYNMQGGNALIISYTIDPYGVFRVSGIDTGGNEHEMQ